jgi:hypothetical protein
MFTGVLFSSLFLHKLRLHSKVVLSIGHSASVKGDQTNFEIEPSFGVKASELYRDVKYTTVDEYLKPVRLILLH